MKIILDSNLIVAAFATRGLCQNLFEVCLDAHQIYASDDILAEVQKALVKKIKMPESICRQIISFLKHHTHLAKPKKVCVPIRDPLDLHIIGLVATVQADFLVTGDKDLLVLEKAENTKILSPRQFWKHLSCQ